MNGIEIIKAWLEGNGYDGLYCDSLECGCFLKDLAPCGGDGIGDCEAGYQCKCTDEMTGRLVDGIGPIKGAVPKEDDE
jgi:hypothetical protein